MNKIKLYWTLQVGGWMAYALGQIVVFQTTSSRQIIFWLAEACIFLLFTHLFRNFIVRNRWLDYDMNKLIPRVLIAVFILSFVIYGTRLLVALPLNIYDPEVAWSRNTVLGLAAVYGLTIFVWSVLYFIYHYFERYNLSLKHEAAVNEIELNNLKAQLNPHFIFNALNSIRALVDENPKKSKNAITQLSNILRNSLASNKKKLTNFEDELRTVKDYLGLESIRFEERLKTEFDIHPDSYNFLVPPLMFQTLVENGIKHGISKLKEGGAINMKTTIENNKLKVQIRNTGTLDLDGASKKDKEGLGLRNTAQRLSLLYGEEASFKIFNESADIVLTELIIPQQT
ncbi:MAG: histidine kinase [Cytophagales bacterium]|nr:histidine kinase [Cytophagales bacterium]